MLRELRMRIGAGPTGGCVNFAEILLSIPLCGAHWDRGCESKVMNDPDSPSPAVRVLVAEDDPICGRALASLLQRHRYEVELVADGQDALDILLGANSPSVVLLDWDMPRLDGLRVARAVRSIPTERYTYLIMVTACDSAEDLLNAFASGVDDFLSKPVSIPQMLARLRGAKRVLALEERLAARDAELERTLDEMKALRRLRPPDMPSQKRAPSTSIGRRLKLG